jgi:asparagine synthase (glutamine-hydrolysing)
MKPLSYRVTGDGLLFGSELRSLLAFDTQMFHVDPASVAKFLAFGYVPEPRTIFADTHKLPPAHYMTWERTRGLEVHRYWTPPHVQETRRPENELVAEVRHLLDRAVASHLESEVPLGAFLSGGLDSSTVVALMCRHASGRVRTFSIGFAEKDFDESGAAREVARALGTEHTELIVRPDVERLFEDIVGVFDEPFADASAIPTFLVAQLAKQQVTVALSGDGGDELFGGYSRYAEVLRARQNWKRFSPRLFAPAVRSLPYWLRGRNWLLNQTRSGWGRYASTVVEPVRLDEGGLAAASCPGGLDLVEEQLLGFVPVPQSEDFAAEMMLVDFCTYLPGDILTKVDRTSMAVSLEARVPLLDSGLLEFALQLPGSLRVSARNSKILFRKAIEDIAPDFVLNRPKQGFGIPLAKWFRGPLRERSERLRDRADALAEYVDTAALNRVVSEHLLGRRDNSGLMWRVMVLGTWLDALSTGALRKPPSIGLVSMEDGRRVHD